CLKRYQLAGKTLASCKGKALEHIRFRHPFYDREAPIYLGEYVTLDSGTGIVHSAPAYGVEDFESCRRYGMRDEDILAPVMGDGRFVASLPLFGGMTIWEANPKIVQELRKRNVLFHHETYTHSYMHCWRHRTPVILRATTQWFAAMDKEVGGETLRATALRGSHKEETGFPAHLYLEGSDQHRGWFHSSLLLACMLDGIPPYKALLTHGFVVDGEGRKMSKSKGNVIAPQEVSHTLGAEILRLWVASTDYSGELFISNEILKHVVESYRRVRNTLRFLLANTADFDAARHAVPVDELLEIDRYALAMTARAQEE